MFESIVTKNAPAAIGPYSQAVRIGDFIYLSGQLPIDPSTNECVEGGIMEQTYQVFANMEAILQSQDLELRHIIKTTVFMSDLSEFESMNQIYATIMSDPYPARSTIEVSKLPKGAKIEIECVVIDTLQYEKALDAHHGHHHHEHDDDCDCESEEADCDGHCCG